MTTKNVEHLEANDKLTLVKRNALKYRKKQTGAESCTEKFPKRETIFVHTHTTILTVRNGCHCHCKDDRENSDATKRPMTKERSKNI